MTPSMLDPVGHARILKDLDAISERSGVPKRFLHESAALHCGPAELDWLLNYYQVGHPGLKITGMRALDRCMAIGGALIRNYIDARVRTMDQMIDDPVEATVLICPNFYTLGHKGQTLPGWRVQKLYDVLCERYKQDQPTVVWTESLEGLKEYGNAVYDLLSSFMTSKN